MRCGYCHNPELALNDSSLPTYSNEDIIRMLAERKNKINAVVLSGGEPALSSKIIPFAEELRGLGFAIKLDTNGTKPAVLAALADKGLVDYAAIDVKTSPAKYKALTGVAAFADVKESVEILKARGINFEIRTTCVPEFGEAEDFAAIQRELVHVPKYCLQQFVPMENIMDAEFAKLTPYPPAHLKVLQKMVSAFADVCIIRGI